MACCYLYLNQRKKANQFLYQSISSAQTEIPFYNLALVLIFDHDFINALKVLNLYWKKLTPVYLQLKKYVEDKVECPAHGRGIVRYYEEDIKKKFNSKSLKIEDESACRMNKKFFKVVENYDWRKFVVGKGKRSLVAGADDGGRSKSLVKLRPIRNIVQFDVPRTESPEEELYGKSKPKKLKKFIKSSNLSSNSTIFIQENVETNEIFSQKFFHNNSKPSELLSTDQDQVLTSPKPIINPKPLKYSSELELKKIICELQKPDSQRNFNLLDSLTRNNIFFSRFKKNTRVKLLSLSKVGQYKASEIILNAGQVVPHFFAILKGSVVLEKLSAEFGSHSVQVSTLYDGQYFGELSLVPQEEKAAIKAFRNTTCKAVEDTVLVMIDKVKYNEILIEQIEFDLEKKYKLLAAVDVFQGINPYLLIPLASSLKIQRFINGDTIVPAGGVPEGLIFILKGFVSLVAEGFRIIENNKSQSSSPRKGKKVEKSEKSEKNLQKMKENNLNQLVYTVSSETWKEILMQVTVEEEKLQSESRSLVTERIEYKILAENDYFATRALVIPVRKHGSPVMASKFSIVAKSSFVEILVFTPMHLNYVSERIQKHLLDLLEKIDDIDCPAGIDLALIKNFFKEWTGFKEKILNTIHHDSNLQKKKNLYHYLPFN